MANIQLDMGVGKGGCVQLADDPEHSNDRLPVLLELLDEGSACFVCEAECVSF